MRGVRGPDSAKSIALMGGSSTDANCHAGISARCAHITTGTRKLLMLGLAQQGDTALDVRLAMSPASPVRVLG
ncbi:hypothetical protein [Streptomyces aureocirculatus]|uniref:hypothetical protein n=1 Tax=Streptomyces aureocirculatus TaxID=67275 RepID=UPI0004CA8792|nr:hypothetical protein [Streptomyces aureocirculatus]